MSNPWLKTSPFMSMWLCSANKVNGGPGERAIAVVQGDAIHASAKLTTARAQQATEFWINSVAKPPAALRTRRALR